MACVYALGPADQPAHPGREDGQGASSPQRFSHGAPAFGPIRDDRLLSAALVAVYDDLAREGALPLGRALAAWQPSALIPPPDRAAVRRATW